MPLKREHRLSLIERIDKTILPGALTFSLGLYALALLVSIAGMEIFGWLTGLLATITYLRMKPKPRFFYLTDYALLGFLLTVIIGAFLTPNVSFKPIDVAGKARWVLLVYALVVAMLVVKPLRWSKYIWFLLGVASLVGLYGVLQYKYGIAWVRDAREYLIDHSTHHPGTEIRFWRSRGLFSMPLTFGYSYAMVVCFPIAALLVRGWQLGKAQLAALFAGSTLIVAAVTFTYSRGAWLALALALGLMLVMTQRRRVVLGATALSGVVFAIFLWVNKTASYRFFSIFDSSYDSNSERLELWRANWEIFLDHPIWGVGLLRSSYYLPEYFARLDIKEGYISHAHSNYFEFLSGTGLLGFGFFMTIALGFLWLTYRLWRETPQENFIERIFLLGAFGAQLVLHLGGFTECNFLDAEVNHMYVFIIAMVSYLRISRLQQVHLGA